MSFNIWSLLDLFNTYAIIIPYCISLVYVFFNTYVFDFNIPSYVPNCNATILEVFTLFSLIGTSFAICRKFVIKANYLIIFMILNSAITIIVFIYITYPTRANPR